MDIDGTGAPRTPGPTMPSSGNDKHIPMPVPLVLQRASLLDKGDGGRDGRRRHRIATVASPWLPCQGGRKTPATSQFSWSWATHKKEVLPDSGVSV